MIHVHASDWMTLNILTIVMLYCTRSLLVPLIFYDGSYLNQLGKNSRYLWRYQGSDS